MFDVLVHNFSRKLFSNIGQIGTSFFRMFYVLCTQYVVYSKQHSTSYIHDIHDQTYLYTPWYKFLQDVLCTQEARAMQLGLISGDSIWLRTIKNRFIYGKTEIHWHIVQINYLRYVFNFRLSVCVFKVSTPMYRHGIRWSYKLILLVSVHSQQLPICNQFNPLHAREYMQ